MKRKFLAVLAALALELVLFTTPAQAIPWSPITYVTLDWNVQHYWWGETSSSVAFVDQYTMSSMKWGGCHVGYRCLHIREHQHENFRGQTFFQSNLQTFIDLSPWDRHSSWTLKRDIVTHELGHAHYVYNHSKGCTSIMNETLPCWSGALPPYSFSWNERQILEGY